MGKFTEEDINRILNLHSPDGKLIDVFDLHGLLFIGNTRIYHVVEGGVKMAKEMWDLTTTHRRYSEHTLPISIGDFELCETEEDVENTFDDLLEEAVVDKLL